MSRRVGAVTIGAAPRPDLTAVLRLRLPDDVEMLERGALDDLAEGEAPPAPRTGGYPLRTQRRDGRTVVADESWLAPRVAAAVSRLEADGATLIVLLCAGGFATVTGHVPLIRPFEVAAVRLRALGATRVGVLVPSGDQLAASHSKWSDAGFDPTVRAGGAEIAPSFGALDALVLDFVGHPTDMIAAVSVATTLPVLDLGTVTAESVAATMRR